MISLFMQKRFQMHSGGFSDFKLECDALTTQDWETLAFLVSRVYTFGGVHGIPSGAVPFQNALEKYITPESRCFLLVDDVFTTGGSMLEAKNSLEETIKAQGFEQIQGLVVFSRGELFDWVDSIFHLAPRFWQND